MTTRPTATRAITVFLVVAFASSASALAGCGAGRDFGYDCSDGQADGYGACITDHHAPKPVEDAATAHFAGEKVDRVACVVANDFDYKKARIRLWLCRRVADGRLITDGRFVCIAAMGGRPVPDAELAQVPRRELICR
jgi:hypothetical protein